MRRTSTLRGTSTSGEPQHEQGEGDQGSERGQQGSVRAEIEDHQNFTQHPKIMSAQEPHLDLKYLNPILDNMKEAIAKSIDIGKLLQQKFVRLLLMKFQNLYLIQQVTKM